MQSSKSKFDLDLWATKSIGGPPQMVVNTIHASTWSNIIVDKKMLQLHVQNQSPDRGRCAMLRFSSLQSAWSQDSWQTVQGCYKIYNYYSYVQLWLYYFKYVSYLNDMWKFCKKLNSNYTDYLLRMQA